MDTRKMGFRVTAIFTLILLATFISTACDNGTTSSTTTQSVAKPTATPAGGNYSTAQTVTLTTGTAGAVIYYTLDGTAPTTGSTKYSSPVTISTTATLKAVAVKTGMTDSAILSETYIITPANQVVQPTATPVGGNYSAAQTVTLATITTGADIYYTLDETAPTTNSAKYSSPVTINASATLKAIAVKQGMTDSDVLTETYTITLIDPDTPFSGDIVIRAANDDPVSENVVGNTLFAYYSGMEEVTYTWYKGDDEVGDDEDELTPIEAGSYTVTISAPKKVSKTSAAVTVHSSGMMVTNGGNAGDGSLRAALATVAQGGVPADGIIRIDPLIGTIALTAALPQVTRSMTIEGNGVTLTRDASWTTTSGTSQLLYINGASANVTIRRVHFKDGRAAEYGAAIRNENATVTVESSIFSGNQTDGYGFGGAVHNNGTMTVQGCTFYGNITTSSNGAAIYSGSSSTLTITGNVFFDNTPTGQVIRDVFATITSGGFNVVDAALGTGSTQAGFTEVSSDVSSGAVPPIFTSDFKVITGNAAAGKITSLPANYPSTDFYGQPIQAPASSGAVQAAAAANGFYLSLSANNNSFGSVSANPAPINGFVPAGSVTLTAVPVGDCKFGRWQINGADAGSANPHTFTISSHTQVQAVFIETYRVTSNADTNTQGTLRHALGSSGAAADGIISIELSGGGTISLTSMLSISRNITIEGNGITITPALSWTQDSLGLLTIFSSVVTVRRVHFKDSNSTGSGGAIYHSGSLTVESCIFSNNRTTSSGGAIYSNSGNTLTVRGSTFYDNRASGTLANGGAIYALGNLNLTGNVFYDNTAPNVLTPSVIYHSTLFGGTVTSGGFNVVDMTMGTGTGQAGFDAHSSDRTLATLLGSNNTSPFVSWLLGDFTPVAGLNAVITSAPADFPVTDFKGAARTFPGAPGAIKQP